MDLSKLCYINSISYETFIWSNHVELVFICDRGHNLWKIKTSDMARSSIKIENQISLDTGRQEL